MTSCSESEILYMKKHACETALWRVSARLAEKHDIFWLPILCPKCKNGMISAKMASEFLVCLKCEAEFRIVEVHKDE